MSLLLLLAGAGTGGGPPPPPPVQPSPSLGGRRLRGAAKVSGPSAGVLPFVVTGEIVVMARPAQVRLRGVYDDDELAVMLLLGVD